LRKELSAARAPNESNRIEYIESKFDLLRIEQYSIRFAVRST